VNQQQHEADQRRQPETQRGWINGGAIAGDDAALLKPAHPLLHARAGQPHLTAQLGVRGAAIEPQRGDQIFIDPVHDRP
jgi:hypothetical protein